MVSLPRAELATYLIQDLGTEPDLCQLEVEGFSNCAWKPRHPVRHCSRQDEGSNQAREGSSLALLPDRTGFGVMGTDQAESRDSGPALAATGQEPRQFPPSFRASASLSGGRNHTQ